MAPLIEMPRRHQRQMIVSLSYPGKFATYYRPWNRSGSGLIGGKYAPPAGFGFVYNIFFAVASTTATSFVFSHNREPARGPSVVQQVFAFTGFLESSLQPGQQVEPQSYRTTP